MTDPADPIHDQIVAAARDAENRFTHAVESLGGDSEQKAPGRVVGEVVDRFMKSIRSGRGQKCEHVGPGPMVIFGAACAPGLVGCASCTSIFADFKHRMDASTGDGRICDGCGERAPFGHTGMVQNGPLILTVSLCNACMKRDDDTPLTDEERKGYW